MSVQICMAVLKFTGRILADPEDAIPRSKALPGGIGTEKDTVEAVSLLSDLCSARDS